MKLHLASLQRKKATVVPRSVEVPAVPRRIEVPAAQKENEAPEPSQMTAITAITTATVGKNWPHMAKLVSMPILIHLLRAVDDMDCTKELNASNADNPKGNKWSRLYDHCFGGVLDVQDNEAPRGLLGGHLSVLLSSSKLKVKIQKVWEYVAKTTKDDKHKVPNEVVIMCTRQMAEYEGAKKAEKDASTKQKALDAELQEKMAVYQKNVGAIPPAARGIEGGGRRQHSTNLNIEEPASTAYVHATTTTPNVSTTTPRASVTTSKTSSLSTTNSSDLHMHSFAGFNRFSDRFERICDRHFRDEGHGPESEKEVKRRRLLDAKKNHMETVTFLSGLPCPSQQTQTAYENALREMIKTNEEIVNLDKELAAGEVSAPADEPPVAANQPPVPANQQAAPDNQP